MKTCTKCTQQFPIEEMRRAYCKSCKAEVEKKHNHLRSKWNKENKEKNKQYSHKYTQQQRQDPLRKLQWFCNIGINRAITQGWYNDKRMKDWIGLSASELKTYIQSKWVEGMDWGNYGRKEGCWNIDHIIPPSSTQTESEVIQLQHYTNLRPLWHSDNIKKRNKRK
jgi:hypothetical protein